MSLGDPAVGEVGSVPGEDPLLYPKPAIDAFVQRLYPHAPAVTVRQTQGGEIWAARGQLGGLSPE